MALAIGPGVESWVPLQELIAPLHRVIAVSGLPMAGKSTLSIPLAQQLEASRIGTGDLCRLAAYSITSLADWLRDGLTPSQTRRNREAVDANRHVDEDIIIALLRRQFYAQQTPLLVLDGFPRKEEQVPFLTEAVVGRHVLVHLDIRPEAAVARLKDRVICERCSAPHSRALGHRSCTHCDGPLIRRRDDTPQALRARMAEETLHLDGMVSAFLKVGHVIRLSSEVTPDLVLNQVIERLRPLL